MTIADLKRSQLESVAKHRDCLKQSPHLRWLFFEITDRCNLRCRHCGSSCTAEGQMLTIDDIKRTLASVRGKKSYSSVHVGKPIIPVQDDSAYYSLQDSQPHYVIQGDLPTVCLTGGEPMMHPDFFEITGLVREMGFNWGMTTNATLIDDAAAENLKQAGMSTVSVSLDGMEEAHDALRQKSGAWRLALRGLESLQKAGFSPQVTTVLHQGNFEDLDPLYSLLRGMGITSWRPINVEPIGRACESADMLLTPDQFRYLLSYIREKRFAPHDPDSPGDPMEVTFGCSHYLGLDYERMVRDHYFLCGAGILTASVRSNGDICACLDIENRPELVQGNVREDDFMEVWLDRFEIFRGDRTAKSQKCVECPERFICGGDSTHTWDFTKNEPLLCCRDW